MTGPAQSQVFQDVFSKPTIFAMHALHPKEFEKFVAYVLRRAGYKVEDVAFRFLRGVDLELSTDGNSVLAGGVEVKRFAPNSLVPADRVQKLMGARAVHGNRAAYLVTTSGFNKAAYQMAAQHKRAFLLDGVQFCRYINYVRGSRYDNAANIRVVIPPDVFAGQDTIWQRGTRHTKALVVANNKGGVGKTTTAKHLALGLAARGNKVLLVDMDPQANLTEAFVDTARGLPTQHLSHYFAGNLSLGQIVQPTSTSGVSILPAHPDLSLLDTGGAGRPEIERRFTTDLFDTFSVSSALLPQPFDWIIMDTPPAISLFTRAALAAADYALVPARARASSLAGIENMLRTLDVMGNLMGNPAKLMGCLVTHWGEDADSRNTLFRLQDIFINRRLSHIMQTKIPYDVTIEKTQGSTHHRASDAYETVVDEVLHYAQHN